MRKIDPVADPLDASFCEKWTEAALVDGSSLLAGIERKCGIIWSTLTEYLENSTVDSARRYRWLLRWITSCTYRLGGLMTNVHALRAELEQLRSALQLQSTADERIIRLQDEVEQLLGSPDEKGIWLSDYVRLRGRWVSQTLSPELSPREQAGRSGLVVDFGDKDEIELTAESFVWLVRKVARKMADTSFPHHFLESARDLLIEVASRSNYSTQDRNVELVITMPDGTTASLRRQGGQVIRLQGEGDHGLNQ
jgi:hypothetical protein